MSASAAHVLRLIQKKKRADSRPIPKIRKNLVTPAKPAPGREQGAGAHTEHGSRHSPGRRERTVRMRPPGPAKCHVRAGREAGVAALEAHHQAEAPVYEEHGRLRSYNCSTPARAQSSSCWDVPPPTPQAPSTTPLCTLGTAPWPMIMWPPSAAAMPREHCWSVH